ncbi:MAG: ABC transporter substrate-binding protein [Acidobacteria bacterium]|nr:ABC transporter substrate-binding protein [Acidobacteriota bacterium]
MKRIPPQFKLLFSFLLLGMVSACRTSPPPAQQNSYPSTERLIGQRGGSLVYRVASPPQTFNYLAAADENTLLVAFYLLGGRLIEFDHDKLSYAPGVAESWQVNNDGRTVEVTLRDGVKFSDGRALTAEDVRFTLQAVYDTRTAAPIFRDALLINGRQIECAVNDPRHLRLTFPGPVAVPESYLSNLAVLPSHVLEAEAQRGGLREAYALTTAPSQIVTAGAFTLQAATPGERFVLRRNPHYWKKDSAGTPLPYLDELVIEVVSDTNNALARVQQGTLDVLDRLRPADYAALRQTADAVRVTDAGPGLTTDHLWFNLTPKAASGKRAWFNDARFRRAVSHAIDRESIATSLLQGLATPLYGFVSPGNRSWVAQDLPRTPYDLTKAQTLLREAGFTLRGTTEAPELFDAAGQRVEFTLLVPTESQPRKGIAAVVQEDLAKLGIMMQVAPLEFGELSRRIFQSFDYDAALLGASVSEPDPSSYANFLRSSSPSHQWHPKQVQPATAWEARIDGLLAEQARERDSARRRASFHELQTILAEQLPVIPLTARHLTSAARQRVGNHRPSMLLPYSLWNAEELFVRQP